MGRSPGKGNSVKVSRYWKHCFSVFNFTGPICFLQDTQEKEGVLPEKAEEAKLKAKYPSLGQKPGGSDFLMKRLQKGVWSTISYPLTLEPKGL